MIARLTSFQLSILFLAGAVLVIGTAWGFELIGGYIPCKLCLQQREPYYAAIALMIFLLAVWHRGMEKAAIRAGLVAIAGIMLYGAGLGLYQAGAEWGFWQGPSDCGATGGGIALDAGSLLDQMQNTRLVSCTEASFRLFGLSFAGWNMVASAALAAIAGFAAVKLDNQ